MTRRCAAQIHRQSAAGALGIVADDIERAGRRRKGAGCDGAVVLHVTAADVDRAQATQDAGVVDDKCTAAERGRTAREVKTAS